MNDLEKSHAELLGALVIAEEGITRLLATGRFNSKVSLGAVARARYAQQRSQGAINVGRKLAVGKL